MSYGCFNRPPLHSVSTSYGLNSTTGEVERYAVQFRMKPDCQYALFDPYADSGCVGCSHRDKALEKRKALEPQKVS